jgi:ketosteroid isomerase-like protein
MPSEAYELVRRTVERFQAGDRVSWRSTIAEDVVWDPSGDETGLFDTYHGHAGLEAFFTQWLGTWEDYSLEHTEIIDADDSVVVVFRQRGRGKGSGVEVDREFYGLYDVRGGKITRYRQFATRAKAVEAAGLT